MDKSYYFQNNQCPYCKEHPYLLGITRDFINVPNPPLVQPFLDVNGNLKFEMITETSDFVLSKPIAIIIKSLDIEHYNWVCMLFCSGCKRLWFIPTNLKTIGIKVVKPDKYGWI